MDALSEEVWRIVTAPYAVSLQRLNTILGSVEQHNLRDWAEGRCDVGALANAIVESLPQSPFALAILQKLSASIPSFRDAILTQEPSLLQTLLGKASASDQGYLQYAGACVALLTVPSTVPLPAEISAFFAILVQRVIEAPSAESIRPVHRVLLGIGPKILEILSSSSLLRLQGQLIQIVSRSDKNSHDTNAFCLAVLAQMTSAELSIDVSSSNSSTMGTDYSHDRHEPFQPARKLFADKNVPKILNLVFGRAVWACSQSPSATVDCRIEVLKLCKKTIEPTNEEVRHHWLLSKPSLSKKLNEYLNRENMDAEVRGAAFDFVAAVHEPKPFPEDLHKAVGNFYCADNKVYCSQMVVENHIMLLDEPSLAVLLLRLLQVAILQDIPSPRGLSDLNVALNLVNGLAAQSAASRGMRNKILYSLSTNEFSIPLQRFSDFVPAAPYRVHNMNGICPSYYARTQQHYRRQLCCLILQVGLYAADGELSLDTALATALLKKEFAVACASSECSAFQKARSTNSCTQASLFETGSTPLDMPSHKWREQLADTLARDSVYQQQHLVKIVGEVCRDLELRCENAEQPFRKEQARSQELHERLGEAEIRTAELVVRIEERERTLSDNEVETCHWKEQAEAADERSNALLIDLEKSRKEVERTKEQAATTAEASSEAARQQDLTYLAIIRGRDTDFQEQSVKIKALEAQISDLTRNLSESKGLEASKASQVGRLEESLAQRTNGLEIAEAQATARLADISRLQEANEGLVATNASINAELSEAAEGRDHLASKLETRILAFDSERIELHTRQEESKAAKAAEMEQLIQSHESTIRKVRKDRETTERTAERAAQQSNIKLKELEKKVGTLRRELANQAMVLAEYRDFNNRMAKLQTRHQSLNYPTMEGVAGDDDQSELIACDAEESPIPHDDKDQLTTSFGSSTSSRSGGPTPKRTKTGSRRSFKPPTTITRAPSHAKPLRRATTGFTVKGQRQALGNLGSASQNEVLLTPTQPLTQKTPRRHTSAAIVENDENERIVEERGFGDMSSDDSDMFTSTSKQRLEIVRDHATRDDYDETTADI